MNDHKLAQTHAHARKYSRAVVEAMRGRLAAADKDALWLRGALSITSRRARRLWNGQTSWTVEELAHVSDRSGISIEDVFLTASSRVAAA